jgi:5-methylcytosine-specific restriction endonuclease McrA
MERALAAQIGRLISQYAATRPPEFRIQRLGALRPLTSFHEWADQKPLVSADRIERDDGTVLHVLLIDWHERGDFYCVLYPETRNGPTAEISRVQRTADGASLSWKYRPVKRDSRNSARVQYFRRHVGDTTMRITVPSVPAEVPRFLRDLCDLAENRVRADGLDPQEPDTRAEFPEGELYERLHRARERSSALVLLAKRVALQKHGKLQCHVCRFDFARAYGSLGTGFIEAHHTRPLSELTRKTKTRLEDLVLVCSNCHRMVHRRRPWLDAGALRRILAVQPGRRSTG